MCKICTEWNLGKLTTTEALNNMQELKTENDDHWYSLVLELLKASAKESLEKND